MANNQQNWPKALANAMNLATSVAAAIALGYFGGKWIDGHYDIAPWASIIGLLLGMATAGKMMWERLMADNKDSEAVYKQRKGDGEDRS